MRNPKLVHILVVTMGTQIHQCRAINIASYDSYDWTQKWKLLNT